MKQLSSRSVLLFFVSFLALASCKVEDPGFDDRVIIDENSAFRSSNFVKSIEQLFMSDALWGVDFTHNVSNEKVNSSTLHYGPARSFGQNLWTLLHMYSSQHVITYSKRSDGVTLTYEYDNEGFISKLTKEKKAEVVDIVHLSYNDKGMLVSKLHEALGSKGANVEAFVYNSDGQISNYISDPETDNRYTYVDGKLSKIDLYKNEVFNSSQTIEYDDQERIKKITNTKGGYETFEYGTNVMTTTTYEAGKLVNKKESETINKVLKNWDYVYTAGGTFSYCRVKENDDDGYTKKKSYYQGTLDNLELIGYTVIGNRDTNSSKKTRESIYNAKGTKIYEAVYTVSNGKIVTTRWYTPDGTEIGKLQISETWVFILVK